MKLFGKNSAYSPKAIVKTFIVCTILISCKTTTRGPVLREVTGKAGDVIVVMPKGKWDNAPGKEVRRILNTPEPGLPQDEPKFSTIFIPTDGFGSLYKTQRNIFLAKIGTDYKERSLKINKGAYAASQLIITAIATSDTAFVNLIKENEDRIVRLIEDTERTRLMETYENQLNHKLVSKIKSDFNLELNIPIGYDIGIQKDNFIWLENSHRDIIENLAIYKFPYTDDSTFTINYLVKQRNRFLKNVPGELQGSYVSTEERMPFYFEEYNLNDKYTAELRGLWRVKEGLAMGGPFISIAQLDKRSNQIVVIEGFIFAPAHKKRNYVRRSEAILYSLNIPNKDISQSN